MKTIKPREGNATQPWNMAMNPEIWRYIFDLIKDPVFLHDAQFRVLLANRAYCREAGVTEVQALGKPYWEVFPLGSGPLPGCKDAMSGKSHTDSQEELSVGEKIFLSKSYVICDDQSKPLYALHLLSDITERKRAEDSLKLLAAKYHSVFELSTDAIMLLNETGFFDCNEATLQLFGCPTRDDFINKHPAELSPPTQPGGEDSMNLASQHIAMAIKNGSNRFEWMHRRFDGVEFPAEVLLTAMELDGKKVLQAVVHDITERKQLEQELILAHTTINKSNNAFYWLSSEGQVESVNDFACKSLGYSREELIGLHVWDFDPDFTQEDWISAWAELKDKGINGIESRHRRKDGSIFPIETTGNYIVSNGVEHAFIFVQDITQRKKLNDDLRWRTAFFEALVSTSADGIMVVDAEGKKILQNQRTNELWKIPKKILKNPDDSQQVQFVMSQTVDPKKFVDKVLYLYAHPEESSQDEVVLKDGTVLDRYSAPVIDSSGHLYGRIWSFRDITERKQVAQELHIAATAFETQEGMIVTDMKTRIMRVNQAFTRLTGYSAKEAIGQTPAMLKSGRQGKNFYHDLWVNLARDKYWQGEIWNRRKNGEVYPEWLTITAVTDAAGQITNYIGAFSDITQHKQNEADIYSLGFYDALTHLPNRRLLMDRLHQALASSVRSGREGALLFIDLDNFKDINDTLGHDIGDLLLQQVAQRLESGMREGDTVARLGGDEFVVMLEDLSESALEAAAQVEAIGEKILTALNQPYQLATHGYQSTASIGVAFFRNHNQSQEELLKHADIAMYQAKKSGRNALRFFDPHMQDAISARVALESELHNALERQQFQLYYQIQVNSSGSPFGAEALIRWLHPERGLVSPFQFIPLAEETGLILPIGQWVLETACSQLRAWQQDVLTRDLALSVNVSAKQFHQVDFVAQVQSLVQRHGINPTLLKLELTESMLLENIEDIITTMIALKEIGVQFSLDDFGTGYSSLQYLKRLPIDQLKIDQSFVRDIANDKAIVSTIIAMANSLGLDVIAEGVETEEQRQLLLNKGCTHYQGYLFGKPVPIEQFESLLKHG